MITIYGASDDLVEVEGCEGADEFNTYEKGPVMWRGDLVANAEEMRIHAIYDDDGCWSFAVGQTGEFVPLPNWPVSIRQHPGIPCSDTDFKIPYSVQLDIDAPDGTKLINVWPSTDGEDES